MRRLAYDVRVEVEVPDDAPDPELRLAVEGDDLRVSLSGGYVLQASACAAPTEDERRDALDAAVALLPEIEVRRLVAELEALRPSSTPGRVRGRGVERRQTNAWDAHREKMFSVYDGLLGGPYLTAQDAAIKILWDEQRRRFGL